MSHKKKKLNQNQQAQESSGADTVQNDNKKSASEQRIVELENQLKQALSDYQSLKRDMEKRLQFEGEMVRADVLRSVIGIADDMDIALSHKEGTDEKAWREGMVMILQKMQSTVEQTGARRIECAIGDLFDPRLHEAVGIVNEGKDGTIAQIVQNGYQLGDKVIRPVRVIVHKDNKV